MSSAFSRRFVELVEQYSGGNKRQFAELTGKSPSHIYRICRGLSRPSMAYLEHIHGLFALDFNWLLTGERVLDIPFGHNSDDLLLVPKLDIEASAGFGAINGAEEVTEQLTAVMLIKRQTANFINVLIIHLFNSTIYFISS